MLQAGDSASCGRQNNAAIAVGVGGDPYASPIGDRSLIGLMLGQPRRCARTAVEAELVVSARDVMLNRLLRNAEEKADFAVRLACADPTKHLQLAFGDRLRLSQQPPALGGPPRARLAGGRIRRQQVPVRSTASAGQPIRPDRIGAV